MKVLVFILIELLLYPVSMVGVILYMGVVLLVNRPRGISSTTYEPFMNRLFWHENGTRNDTAAKQLSAELPATSPLIWGAMMGPTHLAARLSGYTPKLFRFNDPHPQEKLMNMMVLRTQFFDRTLRETLPAVQQLVILGAGWDTRAYDLPEGWTGRVFEVDAPATQAAKVEALEKAGIDASHVTFVAVDFHETSWLSALEAEGFDPALPTYLLWEGVTMYLEEAAIVETLKLGAALAEGSRIGFDYFAAELVNCEPPYSVLGRLIPPGMSLTYGEKIRSGIPMRPAAEEAAKAFLARQGLALLDFGTVGGWYGFALTGRAASR